MFVTVLGSDGLPMFFTPDHDSPTLRAASVFKHLCWYIINFGCWDKNPRPVWIDNGGARTPAHTLSVNNVTIAYDILSGDTPLTTLRPIAWRSALAEIFWIYVLASNDLVDFDQLIGKNTWDDDGIIHNWWKDWAIRDDNGNYILNELGHPTIGCCYGGTVSRHDLRKKLLDGFAERLEDRGHIISLWIPGDFGLRHGLRPCVHKTQFMVRYSRINGLLLDVSVDIRSWDYITAGEINQIQYIMFAEMIACHLGCKLATVRFSIGNMQIYDRHLDLARELQRRTPIPMSPRVVVNGKEGGFCGIGLDDVQLIGYDTKLIREKNPQFNIPVAVGWVTSYFLLELGLSFWSQF